jgi:hypothetical protein
MRRAVLVLAAAAMPMSRLGAQSDASGRWRFVAGADAGAPTGWVQVRENATAGTRLRFGSDLDVRRVFDFSLGAGRRLGARTWADLTITSATLDGRTTLPRDVTFNGATLERGTALQTAVGFPRFMTVTGTVSRRVLALGGGRLDVRGGITFTGLSFLLHGTLAPGSALHETSEDFVTQELPIPLAGMSIELPVAGRFRVFADADGSYLPRVNSLRREGGEVTLRQSGASLIAGLRGDVARTMRVDLGYRASVLAQHEASREDGNDIVLRSSAVALRVTIGR